MSDTFENERVTVATNFRSHGTGGRRISVFALGVSLSSLFAISYIVCVVFDLLFPALAMRQVWLPLLPGVTWLSWPSFILGFVETLAYGWYVALIFGPIFNWFSAQDEQGPV